MSHEVDSDFSPCHSHSRNVTCFARAVSAQVTRLPPVMWGGSIIGFGKAPYTVSTSLCVPQVPAPMLASWGAVLAMFESGGVARTLLR